MTREVWVEPLWVKAVVLLDDIYYRPLSELAQALDCSVSDLAQAIAQLNAQGLLVEQNSANEVRLGFPFQFLDVQRLANAVDGMSVNYFSTLDSTIDWLWRQGVQDHWTLVIAEHQSQGKGQRGRSWQMMYGHTLAISLSRIFKQPLIQLAGLAQVVALALVEAIAPKQKGFGVKWPNDLLFNEGKLVGVLVESKVMGDSTQVVIGFGMNINRPLGSVFDVGQPSAYLSDFLGMMVDRTELIERILTVLMEMLNELEQNSFSSFIKHWQAHDCLVSRQVTCVQEGAPLIIGTVRGVDEQGALCLEESGSGEQVVVHCGSLRGWRALK